MTIRKVLALFLLFGTEFTVVAQQPAGSDWTRVQQIQAGTRLRIALQSRSVVCDFDDADDRSLTCERKRTVFFVPTTQRLVFPRTEVLSVKLSRQPLSLLAGAGIGGGAGAGIGAAIDASAKSQEDGHLATALFALLGAAVGAGVGSKLDFLAAPTLYHAP